MSEDSFESQKVSLGTVLKWAGSLITATVVATGVYFKVGSLEKATDQHEQRIHNIEENVLWRRQ